MATSKKIKAQRPAPEAATQAKTQVKTKAAVAKAGKARPVKPDKAEQPEQAATPEKTVKVKKGAAVKPPAPKRPAAKRASARKGRTDDDAPDELETADGSAEPERKRGKTSKASSKGKSLVIVESPAKARTIKKYLGAGYTVKASVGHVKDLPKSRLGVDVANGFEPEYVVLRDKKKIISEIRAAAEAVEFVYLAPDPDREGEAIAWHIAEELRDINPNIQRVLFNEITRKGITEALKHPTQVDTHKTDAQQARRILDRLVGYEISPILWKKVRRGLSAGRVQSVAVRMICDREVEIGIFKPEEYWTVDADCQAGEPPPFTARIWRWDGIKAEPKTQVEADEIAVELRAGSAQVAQVERKERRRRPQPPFITSKLQQEAARKLRFSAKRTMALAQRLYEGLELGEEGPVGLITYMRTDSTRVSDDALIEVRQFIANRYGAEFMPEEAIVYKTSKSAQDAHEAIRPTSMELTPDRVASLLETAGHPEAVELVKLYTLVWNRFVACQMAPAVYDQTTVDLSRGRATLRATGQVMKFAGYTAVYTEQESDDEAAEKAADSDRLLPPLAEGDTVTLVEVRPEQHFTQPPPRFTEASLVKELEEKGIGRPSTYAAILSTIVDRGYVERRERRFFPTELGTLVNQLLVESFPEIIDTEFTALMEQDLDKVEEGQRDWRDLLGVFYKPFALDLAKAQEQMRDVKREEIPTEYVCEKCGKPMVIKWGRNGSFLACQGYPECRNTKEIDRKPDGTVEIRPEETTDEVCEKCAAPMVVKRGRFGSFLACSRYPDCKTTKPISLGVACPREGCGGFLTEKRSRRGKTFFGCSNYSKTACDFVTWDRPIAEPCPECGAKFMVKKENRSGVQVRCLTCTFKKSEGAEAA
ncbi:MAG TPA: type I DNA topoisomerase [Kofleriaceae bacterium]|nr:type I DNA topoisomerase [Kofleriaceae bacterium]